MSWQKYSVHLVLGFPLSLPIVAYAVNIGDTYVQTQQNQPLNASINVSDINPRTFSVTVAQADVYRQLGLSKDAYISKARSSQVATQVQQKRQATAQQATKVNKLNQDLVGAENRLKIQNTKLAQLEKRLKELNKK